MSHLFLNKDVYSNFLDEQESVHVVKVLRLKEGDAITVSNGNGIVVYAKIQKADHRKCTYIIEREEIQPRRSEVFIHIAVAPTKNMERMEWLAEKCTEFGIDRFSFLLCERSERKILPVQKLEKIAFAALKQSGQIFLPVLDELTPIHQFLSQDFSEYECKMIACLDEDPKPFLFSFIEKKKKCIILIGPEGDFSKTEIALAVEKGFTKVSLGNAILRTETAAIAACHMMNLAQEI